jgi:large repetitive protein
LGPTVAMTSPADGALLNGYPVLTATADDNFGVSRVEFYAGTSLIGTDTHAPFSMTWYPYSWQDGPWTLTAKAYDLAGHSATSSVNVTTDNTSPALTLVSPLPQTYVRGVTPLRATASDLHGVSRMEWSTGSSTFTDTEAPYEASWDTTTVPDGMTWLRFAAFDSLGNQTYGDYWVFVDNTGPTVAITSPAPGTAVRSRVTITADAADAYGVARVDFYDGATLIGTDTSTPYSFAWGLSKVTTGSHTLTARAYDLAGNVTISAPIPIVVN